MTDAREVAAPHALREYAFVADGERGALIGPQGHYVWMCYPSWESPAVFTSLPGGYGVLLETAVRLMPSVPDGDVLDRSPGWG
jgi:alpha,alpha-trehalase